MVPYGGMWVHTDEPSWQAGHDLGWECALADNSDVATGAWASSRRNTGAMPDVGNCLSVAFLQAELLCHLLKQCNSVRDQAKEKREALSC